MPRLGVCTAKTLTEHVYAWRTVDVVLRALTRRSPGRPPDKQGRLVARSPQRPPLHRICTPRKRPPAIAASLTISPVFLPLLTAPPICLTNLVPHSHNVAFRHAAVPCSCHMRCNDPSRSWVVQRLPYLPRESTQQGRPPYRQTAQERSGRYLQALYGKTAAATAAAAASAVPAPPTPPSPSPGALTSPAPSTTSGG